MNGSSYPFNNGAVNLGIAAALARVAYCSDLAGALADPANGLPGWSLAWRPDQSVNGNYAFIAKTTDQYVVSIRGSEFNASWDAFYNWFEQDLNIGHQVAWMYPPDNQSLIAWGSSLGLTDLSQLVDSSSGTSTTMLQYLLTNAIPNKTPIAVVGHSLGGNLTTVLTPWLSYQIQQAGQSVPLLGAYTFAAPTAGNSTFAQKYDALLGANSWRIYNEYDVAPRFAADVAGVGNLWSPAPSPSQISVTYEGFTVTMAEAFQFIAFGLKLAGLQYSQTNATRGSVALNTDGALDPSNNQSTLTDWLGQAVWQHSMDRYLTWIRGSSIVCDKAPRNVVARDAAARRNPKTITAMLDAKIRTLQPKISP